MHRAAQVLPLAPEKFSTEERTQSRELARKKIKSMSICLFVCFCVVYAMRLNPLSAEAVKDQMRTLKSFGQHSQF